MHDGLNVQVSNSQCSVTTTRCDTFSTSYPHFPRPPLYNQWTKWEPQVSADGISHSPSARAGHTAIIMHESNNMVIFGGRSSNGALLSDVWGLNILDISGNNVGTAKSTATNYVTWTKYSPVGHTSKITSTTFDGEFACTVNFEGGILLAKDDLVKITLDDTTGKNVFVSSAHVFEVSSTTSQFRFMSSNLSKSTPNAAYKGTLEIFPEPRYKHVASTMILDQGETMVLYGGIGAGLKVLNDVWLLSFDIQNGVHQWKQVQKSYGNFLAASYGNLLLNFVKKTTLKRYGADMIPVVSSINMDKKGISTSSYIKESLLVLGGVNEKKVPDGYNIDYQSMWHSKEYYSGGKDPLLFHLCPDSDV